MIELSRVYQGVGCFFIVGAWRSVVVGSCIWGECNACGVLSGTVARLH